MRIQDSVLEIPDLNLTVENIPVLLAQTLKAADALIDSIVKQRPKGATFESTLRALEHATHHVSNVLSRIYLIWNVATDETVRKTAQTAVEEAERWGIRTQYREDVYKIVLAARKDLKNLKGESKRYFEEALKDYRRAGLHLPKAKRQKVMKLKEELSKLEIDFQRNLNEAKLTLPFSKAQLRGVPQFYLDQWKKDNQFELDIRIPSAVGCVLDYAEEPETRRAVARARNSYAMDANLPLIPQIMERRITVARLLGYKTWADLKLESRMAKSPSRVMKLLKDVNSGLEKRVKVEMEVLRKMKAKETKQSKAVLESSDIPFYSRKHMSEKYSVDQEAIKNYFPMEATLKGMFQVFERVFGVRFVEGTPPYRWVSDLKFYEVIDQDTRTPMGAFYLDLFPRPGKFSHFAHFTITQGGRLTDGTYLRPVSALVCNFPHATADSPSLLRHSELETLFHEFGHCMHAMLTEAEISAFSGTSVQWDFVESPSQILENWAWDKKVLDSFAADYRDPSKRFPADLLERMNRARQAVVGRDYRRQVALGMMDMALHTMKNEKQALAFDYVGVTNAYLKQSWGILPLDGTAFVAHFGHLFGGYDSGYYGYLWAEAIAEDLASPFRKSRKGFLDEKLGRKLRSEVYAAGNSRDPEVSVRKFLGRKRSLNPFLTQLGIR